MSNFDQRFYLIGCAITAGLDAENAIKRADEVMAILNPPPPDLNPDVPVNKRINLDEE
jgi:hypothetical protein